MLTVWVGLEMAVFSDFNTITALVMIFAKRWVAFNQGTSLTTALIHAPYQAKMHQTKVYQAEVYQAEVYQVHTLPS